MSKLIETIYVGRDNAIRLTLSEDSVPLKIAYPNLSPTRWLMTIHTDTPIVFDSSVDSTAFDWDDESSVLQIQIGPLVTAENAVSKAATTLRMFSGEFPNGVVFAHPTCTKDKLFITICSEG
jgi:hypothetical protein